MWVSNMKVYNQTLNHLTKALLVLALLTPYQRLMASPEGCQWLYSQQACYIQASVLKPLELHPKILVSKLESQNRELKLSEFQNLEKSQQTKLVEFGLIGAPNLLSTQHQIYQKTSMAQSSLLDSQPKVSTILLQQLQDQSILITFRLRY